MKLGLYLILAIVLNGLDTWSTFWLAQRIGWAYEGNPVIRWLVFNLGEIPTVAIKTIVPSILLILLWQMAKKAGVRWLPWLFLAIYALVPGFNLVGVVFLSGVR